MHEWPSLKNVMLLQSSAEYTNQSSTTDTQEHEKQKLLLQMHKEKQQILYTKNEQIYKGIILRVHTDNPPEPYYDVQLENGATKQTTSQYIKIQ